MLRAEYTIPLTRTWHKDHPIRRQSRCAHAGATRRACVSSTHTVRAGPRARSLSALLESLPEGAHELTVSCPYRAPKFTIHSASSNLHVSMSTAHRYTNLPRYNLDKISIFSCDRRGHTQTVTTAPEMRPRRTSRSRSDPGPPLGPAQPAWSRLGATRGSPGLQSRAHCQTRQASAQRRLARSLSTHHACRRWRLAGSTHANGTGSGAGTVAGAHNTHAATVEGR